MIVLLLSITTLQMSGQFVVFTFMGPLLARLTNASPDAIGLVFALYGVFGFIGRSFQRTSLTSLGRSRWRILTAAPGKIKGKLYSVAQGEDFRTLRRMRRFKVS